MSITLLVVVSGITAAEALFILYSFNKHWLKVILGYKSIIDVIYGLGLTAYMMTTGTLGGIVIAAFGGFIMTLSLAAAAKLFGYRKRVTLKDGTKVWEETAPAWTMDSIKDKFLETKDKLNSWLSKKDQKVHC